MSVIMVAPRIPMALGDGKIALWHPLPATSGGSSSEASIPSGAGGYWDASSLSGMLDASGSPVVGWGLNVSAVKDQTGAQNLTVYSAGTPATLPQSTPRLNGTLGGLGLSTVVPPNALPAAGQYLPVMAADQGFQLPGQTFGASTAWTWYLVWSRPNWRQGGSTAAVALMTVGSTPIVTLDSAGATAILHLFPTGANAALSSTITRRHTHALILVNAPGSGVSAWLDGTQVATNIANPLGAGGIMTLLHDTTAGGGAQCWFHEAAYWPSALTATAITELTTASARWVLGARRGVNILVNGQSNAANGYGDGAWHLMAQGIAWYLGALAGNVLGGPYTTLIGGSGLYSPTLEASEGFHGSFLNDPNDGSDPSTWSPGQDGAGAQTYVTGLPAVELADVAAIFWPWSETDSVKAYSEKATFEAAQQRYLALMRGWVGKTAAQCPLLMWNAIPFQYFSPEPGNQMVREACYDLTQAAGQNAWIVLPQTSDSISRSATPNSDGTWVEAGSDAVHRSVADNQRFGVRAVAAASAAILASSGGDTISVIPSGVTRAGGPRITHVYQQAPTQYVLMVTHDAGNDLIVNGQAANGAGFVLMDGGSMASPGPTIPAVSCVRQDATHLLVTLLSAPANPAASCLFFYPYGGMNNYQTAAAAAADSSAKGATAIGRGEAGNTIQGATNAVTDNAASLTPPAGWDITNQLGSSWGINYPLAATTYGIVPSTAL